MGQLMQQMMEHLLDSLKMMLEAFCEEMKVHVKRMDAKEGAHLERMEDAVTENLSKRNHGALVTKTELNPEVTEACPEKLKASLKEMEAVVGTFEESADKIEAMNLETNLKATEIVVE
jgi:hypothetical protein